MGRRLRCPGLAARPPECGSFFSPTQSAQLPTWNKALSQKAQEKSQMLTHLPDMGMLQPKCLEACAGGLAGQAPCGPELQLHGAASKSQAFFPERFRFERLNRFRWAYPLLLLLHPLALKISERDCLFHIYIWVADRILRKSPRFYVLTLTLVCTPHRIPRTENMTDFTAMMRLCYMIQLIFRNGDYLGGSDLVTRAL